MATQPAHTDAALYYLCANNNPATARWRVVKETDKFYWVQERSRGVQTWSCAVEKRGKAYMFGERLEADVVDRHFANLHLRKMALNNLTTATLQALDAVRYATTRLNVQDDPTDEHIAMAKQMRDIALQMKDIMKGW